MKTINTIFILAIGALLWTACQTNPANTNNPANQTANKATANAAQNTNQTNKPETNTSANNAKTETNSTSADSPTAAYKAYYAARKNKDIQALKQLISKEMFEFFEILGEGKPNALEEGLKEMAEQPLGPSDETRNEKIKGDTATLEYRNPKGEWETGDLVKENGKWKLTIAKMDQSDEKESGKKPK
jgi:cytoskeletal protein RodZ